MKLPAIIQIRNGSTRLPNKAMKEILGRPILDYLIARIKAMSAIDRIAVATSTDASDDGIAQYCHANTIDCYRGSVENVLERVFQCAKRFHMEQFVKFWGDSPLVDVFLCDEIVTRFFVIYADVDYLSNNHPSTYPEGMQVEIIRTKALELALGAPDLTMADREHATSYLWMHPEQFSLANIAAEQDTHDDYRLVLDYHEDWHLIEAVILALSPVNPLFSLDDIKRFLDAHPEIKELNRSRYETEKTYNKRVFGT